MLLLPEIHHTTTSYLLRFLVFAYSMTEVQLRDTASPCSLLFPTRVHTQQRCAYHILAFQSFVFTTQQEPVIDHLNFKIYQYFNFLAVSAFCQTNPTTLPKIHQYTTLLVCLCIAEEKSHHSGDLNQNKFMVSHLETSTIFFPLPKFS